MRNYARVIDGVYMEYFPGRLYDAEAIDWVPGEPSRIGLEMSIAEWLPPWIVEELIEVTGLNPQPAQDWTYDYETRLFSLPTPPYIDPRPRILAELDQIDRDSIRYLRAWLLANSDLESETAGIAQLRSLELRAVELTAQLETTHL